MAILALESTRKLRVDVEAARSRADRKTSNCISKHTRATQLKRELGVHPNAYTGDSGGSANASVACA